LGATDVLSCFLNMMIIRERVQDEISGRLFNNAPSRCIFKLLRDVVCLVPEPLEGECFIYWCYQQVLTSKKMFCFMGPYLWSGTYNDWFCTHFNIVILLSNILASNFHDQRFTRIQALIQPGDDYFGHCADHRDIVLQSTLSPWYEWTLRYCMFVSHKHKIQQVPSSTIRSMPTPRDSDPRARQPPTSRVIELLILSIR
jgi:hypothetical protein